MQVEVQVEVPTSPGWSLVLLWLSLNLTGGAELGMILPPSLEVLGWGVAWCVWHGMVQPGVGVRVGCGGSRVGMAGYARWLCTGVLAVSEIPLKQGNSVTKPFMGSQN